ncbi:metallophosphoesterase [Luteibacter aegosomaticola]|uniref:metallophosphoesterase family protein n=1 Tax=Luteibacter aegosomaticola TaxID=2911538 RepID=UPI001FFB365A|nr:metallophosphoesterase [Luteibacter aegosomaticola]UPG88188.1 metallophosphoesterase [Luteibacter aegosomaticola]
MGILILHLSDMHLDDKVPGLEERAAKVTSAALSPLMDVDEVHIVISGDIASTGAVGDFSAAGRFLAALDSAILDRTGSKPVHVLAAGNHDCDFSAKDQSVRDVLLKNIETAPNAITDGIAEGVASVLGNYRSFARQWTSTGNDQGPWLTVHELRSVRYVVLHSAVTSRLKEVAGKLHMPTPAFDYDGSRRTVLVMHHPLNWLTPESHWPLAQWAPLAGDLFLMGHEHINTAERVSNLHEDASMVYLHAHVFHDAKHPDESAFQTIYLDQETGYQPRAYAWRGDHYGLWEERSKAEMLMWPGRAAGALSLSADGLGFLSSPGANYTHRRVEKLRLQDIYVWPDIKPGRPEKDTGQLLTDALVIPAASLVSGKRSPVVIIRGGERHGKTSLAKMMMLGMQRSGVHPIYFSATHVSSWRERALEERFDEAVDLFYGKKSRDVYRQLPPASRALVIDDFDLPQLKTGFAEGVRLLARQFGTIYLMVDAYPGMEVALEEFLASEHFSDTELFDLLPSKASHRMELIERWIAIGAEPLRNDDPRKIVAAKLCKVVDETLGRNLLPALPVFVLIILQRAELAQDLDTVVQSGSHGFLYESMILTALQKVSACDVVTSQAYLVAFAAHLDALGREQLSQEEFERFHVAHCERFHLGLSLRTMQAQLVAADLLDESGSCVRFCYEFHYYYFFARHLSQTDWVRLEPRIDALVASIHTERSANVLLFLAHIQRDVRIAEKILVHAEGLFAEKPEVDLFDRKGPLPDLSPGNVRHVLLTGSRTLELESHHQDEVDADCAQRDVYDVTEQRLQQRLNDALAMNGAFKTLQVLGQVLRNHAGEIERDEKARMADTCVALGLRILSFLHEFMGENGNEMLIFRAIQLRKEDPELTETDITRMLETYLPSFVSSTTVGTLIKIANAVGSETLTRTLDDVLGGTDTRRLLRLITTLEHFSDFPADKVLEFEKDTLRHAPPLPQSVLRRFLLRRFYLFPVREELKRAVLDRFRIESLPFQALAQRRIGRG